MESVYDDVTEKAFYEKMGKYMHDNGKACAQTLTLYATYDAGDEGLEQVRTMVGVPAAALLSEWSNELETTGTVSAETKADMRDYCLKLVDAQRSYNDGAKEGITSKFDASSLDATKSYAGLAMVNREYMNSVMTIIKDMDKNYHFMDEAAWTSIEQTRLFGVDCMQARSGVVDYNATGKNILETASVVKETEQAVQNGEADKVYDNKDLSSSSSGNVSTEDKEADVVTKQMRDIETELGVSVSDDEPEDMSADDSLCAEAAV